MTLGFVQDVAILDYTHTGQTLVITTGKAVAQGNFLVVIGVRSNSSGEAIAGVADSQGNSYTVDFPGLANGPIVGVATGYMTTALTATDTVTITWTKASAYNYFYGQLTEYSGISATSWFDKSASLASYRTQAQGFASGNTATLSEASELVLGIFLLSGANQVLSATSPYNMRAQGLCSDGSKIGIEDKTVSETTAVAAAGTWESGNQNMVAICVTYKAAGGGLSIPLIMEGYRRFRL